MRALPPPLSPLRGNPPSHGYSGSAPAPSFAYEEPHAAPQISAWRLFVVRKWTLISFIAAGCALGILVSMAQTPMYRTRVQLEVQDLNSNFLNIQNVTPVNDSGAAEASSDVQTQIKLLQTNALMQRTIDTMLTNESMRQMQRPHASLLRRMLGRPADQIPYSDQLQKLGHSIEVRAVGQSRIIEVAVPSNDPDLSAAFLNTLCNAFIDQSVENRWKMSQRTGEWLDRVLDAAKDKLAKSEAALQEYAARYGLLVTDDKHQQPADDNLNQLEQELSRAQTDRIAKQSRYEISKAAVNEEAPEVLDDPALREYEAKLADLNRQMAELATTYTKDHPKVTRIAAQIASLRADLKAERDDMLNRIRAEYDQAVRREALLTRAYQSQYNHLSGQSDSTIHYTILQREVESNRQLYDAMLQRAKDATVATALRASNIRVVDPAVPPAIADSPKVAFGAGLGLFAGLLAGGMFVWVRTRDNQVFREPGEITSLMGLPELGAILHVSKKWIPQLQPQANTRQIAALSNTRNEPVSSWQQGPSLIRDSFRHVLASILLAKGPGAHPRTLVITSAGPGEGKTTLSANLAAAVAEAGRNVLLIDGDLRRPRLHELYGLPLSPGFAEVLRNPDPRKYTGTNTFATTSVPGLSVLTAGTLTKDFTQFVHSASLGRFLESAAEQFDLVLVDSPPVLLVPDARVYGSVSGGVLLVARSGVTTRAAVASSSQRLLDDGCNLLGVVLNDWDPSLSPYSYRYKSYQYGGTPK